MDIVFLPEPKHLRRCAGRYQLPLRGIIAFADAAFLPAAKILADDLAHYRVLPATPAQHDAITLAKKPVRHEGGYRLAIDESGIRLEAEDGAGMFAACHTLRQIYAQCPQRILPCFEIDDWPDFAVRGIYYDVCRGRVPKLKSLLAQARLLAAYKINQLQYYIEHTYRFRGHPLIGRSADPLTPDDIITLDRYCQELGIELVPSLASFGHMGNVLTLAPYRHLAEDYGIGKYRDISAIPEWARHLRGWTLSPANPEVYNFLDSLFAEFLPCFSSNKFNVCCDETWDLGCGQSYNLCHRKGKGEVYLSHIIKLSELCRKYGKRMMFWGDIIRHYPRLISRIPKDVIVLDWGYGASHNFEAIRDFTRTGLETYACPGTSSWVSLFPRLPEAEANIAGFAAAGKKHGAAGLLTTDWGDGGHYNFMEYSWPGYLFGAEQAWNIKADRRTFHQRFCRLFLRADDPQLAWALRELGDISHLWAGPYQSIWTHIYFALPGDQLFASTKRQASISRNGKIFARRIALNASLGRQILKRLATVRRVISAHSRCRSTDPEGVLAYWLFAVDTIAHAARKLTVFGAGGGDTPTARAALRHEMTELRRRFISLWQQRNRKSEIDITLKRYRQVLQALR